MGAWLLALTVVAAEPTTAVPQDPGGERRDTTARYDRTRIRTSKAANFVLGGWAVANFIGGAAGTFTTSGTQRFFWQGNAIWNTVNVTLATVGLVNAYRAKPGRTPWETSLRAGVGAQRVFALNFMLDLVYLGGAAWLWDAGVARDSDRLVGYGQAVVLQGGFLLVYDAVLWGVHRRNNRRFAFRLAPYANAVGRRPVVGVAGWF